MAIGGYEEFGSALKYHDEFVEQFARFCVKVSEAVDNNQYAPGCAFSRETNSNDAKLMLLGREFILRFDIVAAPETLPCAVLRIFLSVHQQPDLLVAHALFDVDGNEIEAPGVQARGAHITDLAFLKRLLGTAAESYFAAVLATIKKTA